MNEHILKKIYNDYYKDFIPNVENAELINLSKDILIGELNSTQIGLFNDFIETYDEYLSYENFRQGFRANMLLTVEVLQA